MEKGDDKSATEKRYRRMSLTTTTTIVGGRCGEREWIEIRKRNTVRKKKGKYEEIGEERNNEEK